VQRRILVVALIAVALAVTLLGAPLALVQSQLLREDEKGELVQLAVELAVTVPRNLRETDGKPTIPDEVQAKHHVAIYDGDGNLLAGAGPSEPDDVVRQAMSGKPVNGFAGRDLVATVPVMRGEDVVAVVRVSSPKSELDRREILVFGAVIGVAVFASFMAMLLALRLAWRLSAPIRVLQTAAEELGDGNFAVRAPGSGIRELDAVADSMNATAHRLGQLVDRERAFTAHASHQLRTPLTALRLRLDTALQSDPVALRAATVEATAIVDDLEATVEDLLAVSRGRSSAVATLDLDSLLAGLPQRWQGLLTADGRALRIRQDDPPPARARAATVRQVLDVLLDNAYRHGGGAVQVVAREASGALAIDVIDEGRPGTSPSVHAEFSRISAGGRTGSVDTTDTTGGGEPTAGNGVATARPRTARSGTGIGLGLARSLLVADGGRLLLTSAPGRTCATVLLPATESGHDM
jgi:signal transduction histidine kinase